jgi:hypothetical protein
MQTTLAAIAAGSLNPPPPGTGKTGICPTTRDFRIVDMDQSDNVVTTYLLINNQVLAQNSPENAKNSPNATTLSNGSDNALVDIFLDPISGCTPWTGKSPTTPTGSSSALALNELVGSKFQQNPALIPLNDDMVVITTNNGNIEPSLLKVNLYRAAVGQPLAKTLADASGTTYCKNFASAGIWIAQNQALFLTGTSPDPTAANNLFTFLAQRFAASFGPVPALGCQEIFGLQNNPVTMTTDGNGVVTAATINTQVLQQIFSGQIQSSNSTVVVSSATSITATTATTANNATATTTGTIVKSSFGAKFTHRFSGHGGSFQTKASSAAATTTAASSDTTTTTLASPTTTNPAQAISTGLQRHPWGNQWWGGNGWRY